MSFLQLLLYIILPCAVILYFATFLFKSLRRSPHEFSGHSTYENSKVQVEQDYAKSMGVFQVIESSLIAIQNKLADKCGTKKINTGFGTAIRNLKGTKKFKLEEILNKKITANFENHLKLDENLTYYELFNSMKDLRNIMAHRIAEKILLNKEISQKDQDLLRDFISYGTITLINVNNFNSYVDEHIDKMTKE